VLAVIAGAGSFTHIRDTAAHHPHPPELVRLLRAHIKR
jgi:hypothetical protein